MPFPAEPVVLPPLYATGNLRVDVSCADYWAAPERGLALTLDGAALDPLRTNSASGTTYAEDGSPITTSWSTDVGFLVEPGRHHVSITAPGCTPTELDVEAHADHAELATGRLATEAALATPTAAPNGFGLVLGALVVPAMRGPSEHVLGGFGTSYTYDANPAATGAWLGLTVERRAFVFAIDWKFASGALSGTALQTMTIDNLGTPGPFHFAGSAYEFASTLRLGARVSLDHVALAAGSGVGFETWIDSTSLQGVAGRSDVFADAPDGPDGSWLVPLWSTLTWKPSCNWGVQVLGEYDIHPTALATNGIELGAGVLFQPSDACSATPGVRVAPI
jgi:hypothetical protein